MSAGFGNMPVLFHFKVLLANTFCAEAFFKNNYMMTQLQKRKYNKKW